MLLRKVPPYQYDRHGCWERSGQRLWLVYWYGPGLKVPGPLRGEVQVTYAVKVTTLDTHTTCRARGGQMRTQRG